jgi:general secretion pathway protein C
MGLLGRSSGFFTSWQKGSKKRPPFEAFYIYLLALWTGYLVADLGILGVRPGMLPSQPPPVRPAKPPPISYTSASQYAKIQSRNIFNQDGKIAPPLTAEGAGEGGLTNAEPVPSQLPLKLEGTLVHTNPKKSVASVNLKSKNETISVMEDGDIDNIATVTKIERRKVIFINNNLRRLEYIDIPRDTAVTFGVKEPAGSADEVTKKGEFDFTMRRSDIAKYTADLGSVLQQARMVPNIVPGSGGRVEGFRFVAIQPNSIYDKLGFKPMDVIKGVNGEEVNSPTKAMELYNALKSEGRITLTVERNGRTETFNYNISE